MTPHIGYYGANHKAQAGILSVVCAHDNCQFSFQVSRCLYFKFLTENLQPVNNGTCYFQ